MEQYQTSWSRKNSVRQRAERFSQSKNLAETGGKWKMYFTLISLSTQWGPKAHTLFAVFWEAGRRLTPSSEWNLKGPHLISSFTQWAACSPYLLLSDSYNTYTKVKVAYMYMHVYLVRAYMYMHIYVYIHAFVYGCVCAFMIFLDTLRRCCWDFLSAYEYASVGQTNVLLAGPRLINRLIN